MKKNRVLSGFYVFFWMYGVFPKDCPNHFDSPRKSGNFMFFCHFFAFSMLRWPKIRRYLARGKLQQGGTLVSRE